MSSSEPIDPTLIDPNQVNLTSIVDAPDRTIKVLEETVRIEKRLVETDHARVSISVSERDEPVEATLMRQDLAIERVPIGSVVTEAPPTRREGDVMIIPVLEEILVVEKRLILKEELHIRITEAQHAEKQVVRLRTEHAVIDHGDPITGTGSST